MERKLKKNVWKIIVRPERKVKKERVKEEIRMSDDNGMREREREKGGENEI